MSRKNTLLRTVTFPNRGTIHEYDHHAADVHFGTSSDGRLALFTAGITHFTTKHAVSVYHFQGATPEQRESSFRFAALVLQGRINNFPWTYGTSRYDGKPAPSRWVDIGDHIDELKEFQRLRRGLHTDDAIDLEFQSIVQEIEVYV